MNVIHSYTAVMRDYHYHKQFCKFIENKELHFWKKNSISITFFLSKKYLRMMTH